MNKIKNKNILSFDYSIEYLFLKNEKQLNLFILSFYLLIY